MTNPLDDLGPLPEVHPRERLITTAEDEIRQAIGATLRKHKLTAAEAIQVINTSCSREVSRIAGNIVRKERKPKPIEVDPTPEGIAAAEKELAETNEAITKVRALFESPLWEDLQVAALNLNDATDDMNDQILALEKTLREQKYLPGSIPLQFGALFLWDGERLRLDDLRSRNPLSSQTRAIRIKLLGRIPDLVKTLTKAPAPV